LDIFYDLLIQTSQKNRFPIPSKDYFNEMLINLGESINFYYSYQSPNPESFDVFKEPGQVLSCALIPHFGSNLCYLWAASQLNLPNNLPAQYAVIFKAIMEGKQMGSSIFDFWGLKYSPEEVENGKPKEGYDTFKTGFGGQFLLLARPRFFAYKPLKFHIIDGIAKLRKGLKVF
jgi:lipid II:glycine glycyltransferase (peptidoglycan interpeptide bridge formation enzyme)